MTSRRSVTESATSTCPGELGAPRPELLTGCFAVALLLAATRWGSYLGAPPVFLTDMLLAAAILHQAARRGLKGPLTPAGSALRPNPGALIWLLLLWAGVRLLLSAQSGQFPFVALRDFAPYGYAVVALISARSYYYSVWPSRVRTERVLRASLLVHAIWVLPVALSPELAAHMPAVGETTLFALRPDIDCALLGVLAGLYAHRLIVGQAKFAPVIVLSASIVGIMMMSTRAGFLGAAAAITLSVVVAARKRHEQPGGVPRPVSIGLVLLGILLIAPAIVPHTPSGDRLLESVGLGERVTTESGLTGTERARLKAWGRVADYTSETDGRVLFGVGFGPDFLYDSGAQVPLEGTTYEGVRSPHNYLVGTYARLGVIGLGLTVGLWVVLLLAIRCARSLMLGEPMTLIAGMLVLAILPTALLGVVLESPFGAVPFFWAAGILLSHPLSRVTGANPKAMSREGPKSPSLILRMNHLRF